MAALFLDHFSDELEGFLSLDERNWKSLLNEWLQKEHRGLPKFTLVSQAGPDHSPQFTVEVAIDNKNLEEGTAASKKDAEQIAAKMAYEKLVSTTEGD